MSTVLAASLALVLGQYSWQAGLRGQTRLGNEAAGDLLLSPGVALEYGVRSLVVQGRYDPDLLLREPRARGTISMLQRGAAISSFVVGHDTRVVARGRLVAGESDQSWLASSSDSVPTSATRPMASAPIESFEAGSSVAVTQPIGRHFVVGGVGGYAVSGGVGDTATLLLPRTATTRLDATAEWVERLDAVSVSLGGSRGSVSNGRTFTSVDGLVGWRHALSAGSQRALTGEPVVRLGDRPAPRYEIEVAAGASRLGGNENEKHEVVPTASMTLRRDESALRTGALSTRITLRYAPVLDPTTGALGPRVEGAGAVDLRLRYDLVAFVRGGLGWTIDATPPAPKLGQAGVGVSWEASRRVAFAAEIRQARLPNTEWAAVVTTTLAQRGNF